jgi:hypothetical protein
LGVGNGQGMPHLSGLSFSCLAVAGIAVAVVVVVAAAAAAAVVVVVVAAAVVVVEEHLSFPVKQTYCYSSSFRELGLVG